MNHIHCKNESAAEARENMRDRKQPMIFISSSSVTHPRIADSIRELAELGYRNIELSGGTSNYDGLENDLFQLREEYGLNYLLHNYFPPPKRDFVLNLASLDEAVFNASVGHCREAIGLSKKLGCDKYAMHAGFFMDLKLKEIGKELSSDDLFDAFKARKQFRDAFNHLKDTAGSGLTLYLENNVISAPNYETFKPHNPFMLTCREDYDAMQAELEFNLLLDVGHLLVSCRVLGKNFEDELSYLARETDYIHISNNNAALDENKSFDRNSQLARELKVIDLSNKTITLEVYESHEGIRTSLETIESLIDEN